MTSGAMEANTSYTFLTAHYPLTVPSFVSFTVGFWVSVKSQWKFTVLAASDEICGFVNDGMYIYFSPL